MWLIGRDLARSCGGVDRGEWDHEELLHTSALSVAVMGGFSDLLNMLLGGLSHWDWFNFIIRLLEIGLFSKSNLVLGSLRATER